jgi:hypothetical protein
MTAQEALAGCPDFPTLAGTNSVATNAPSVNSTPRAGGLDIQRPPNQNNPWSGRPSCPGQTDHRPGTCPAPCAGPLFCASWREPNALVAVDGLVSVAPASCPVWPLLRRDHRATLGSSLRSWRLHRTCSGVPARACPSPSGPSACQPPIRNTPHLMTPHPSASSHIP